MITLEKKKQLLAWLEEATSSGARAKAASEVIGISLRTSQRWKKTLKADKRPTAKKTVAHKLSEKEVQNIIAVCNSPAYRDRNPAEIVALLAEKGVYLASERTMYRILKKEQMLTHRRKSKCPSLRRKKQSHEANGPRQLISWDITYLQTCIRGQYFYLYLFVDLWSRMILGWSVEFTENSRNSSCLVAQIAKRYDIRNAVLHSDNGGPMKGSTMLATLHRLAIAPSFSRPSVSQDNSFSESLFKTLKYRPSYPEAFASIEDARTWVANFVNWYNTEHLHSAINWVTPEDRFYQRDQKILAKRRETYEQAYAANPARWSRKPKKWKRTEFVFLNSQNKTKMKIAS